MTKITPLICSICLVSILGVILFKDFNTRIYYTLDIVYINGDKERAVFHTTQCHAPYLNGGCIKIKLSGQAFRCGVRDYSIVEAKKEK